MSHLPLDARAILSYLNELGYRNISAEQLREFMKGMQPQSDIESNKKAAITNQQSLPTPTTATPKATTQQNHKHHRSPKIIKGKKPLIHFKFYLDIREHQVTKSIEEKINALGGNLEFFLTPSVTHFVTDKTVGCNSNNNNNNTLSLSKPGTPQTPVTPGTPYSYEQSPCESLKNAVNSTTTTASKKQSRADAMLNRARRQSTTTVNTQSVIFESPTNNNNNNICNNNTLLSTPTSTQPYIIWTTEYALRFFKRISHDLKDYLEGGVKKSNNGVKTSGSAVEPISLKGGFIKIEAIKRNQRPYYQLFRKPTEWPKIELNREDGAFRLSPKRKPEPEVELPLDKTKMTRKSRSRSSQRQHVATKDASLNLLKKGEKSSKKSAKPGATNTVCKQLKESSDKQCGVCEICKIEYDTLTIHLKTKDHEYFAKNTQNFIALDTLIHASADVNKFLDANKSLEDKSDLEEEMEVAEEEGGLETDVPDPLEDHQPNLSQDKRRSVGHSHKTPSPSLREKSKRSTKGKHSSEKFQNISAVRSARSASVSPHKKSSGASSSKFELQSFKNEAIPAAATTRKKSSVAIAISPPIRAMLPPSSLYKVVETTLQDGCKTPPRKLRDIAGENAAANVASPSLIVKFKKVRQTELSRLNGEAENFMFPRRRISSELPTDTDRQTTSESAIRASTSSTGTSNSLDSECQMEVVDVKTSEHKVKPKINETTQRVIAVAKRRKGRPPGKQSFRNAPIQPEEFTLKQLPDASGAALVTTKLLLPEATRKSSRAATAIVTAATTSSRLLRAAVEAAKNNQRLGSDISIKKETHATSSKTTSKKSLASTSVTAANRRNRFEAVVKLEDRMGDTDEDLDTDQTDNDEEDDDANDNGNINDEIDDDSSDEDEEQDDDDDDKDYVSSYNFKKQPSNVLVRRQKRFSTNDREQRAVDRETKRSFKQEAVIADKEEEENVVQKEEGVKATKIKMIAPAMSEQAAEIMQASKMSNTPSPKRAFDLSRSERIPKQRYAFERVPAADLWFRVFNRQDACEEQIFEYYGSTSYRKLPYELGPIPFDRSLDGVCCKLCGHIENSGTKGKNKSLKLELKDVKESNSTQNIKGASAKINNKTIPTNPTSATAPSSPTLSCTASSSNFTHKKLHLLQRYRREQQELLQKQQADQQLKNHQLQKTASEQLESKASTPEREHEKHEKRAGSIHSNASSCASSTGTTYSKKFPRTKHLNKAAFLNIELPPRKSPREHASTLALVSCLIKQRQDSQSKPNSETDEPASTPTTLNNCAQTVVSETTIKPPPPTIPPELAPPQLGTETIPVPIRSTRSAAGTPVEELRFATEISENVKRLRRGQNKYDHSPTVSLSTSRPRGGPPQTLPGNTTPTTKLKRRRWQPSKYHSFTNGGAPTKAGKKPSIRKTGSKKGVLEFEVDAAALKALDTAKEYTNSRQLEWEIDKYLQLAGRNFDLEPLQQLETTVKSAKQVMVEEISSLTEQNMTTPPATDYFSSDFDLCDLFTIPQNISSTNGAEEDSPTQPNKRNRAFSLYSSVALQNYFRKRKSLKSNRTGWPKIQKKKSSARQQQKLTDKIRFLQAVVEPHGAVDGEADNHNRVKADDHTKDQTRQSVVITPPDSDDETKTPNEDDDDEEDDTELDAADSIPEEDYADTMAEDSVDDREADVEEDEDDENIAATVLDDEQVDEDSINYEPVKKRARRATIVSPAEKLSISTNITPNVVATTSTPSTQLLRSLRRSTPHLNGSLGSCVSPSEKAGDNSDIFTVSSDGLETDLDLSNSHLTQLKPNDDHESHCANHPAKRKFDLAKYAASNNAAAHHASSTCGAEASTMAAKSLAISQFLKKEVKVQCRRLRAPFRRFRYRR